MITTDEALAVLHAYCGHARTQEALAAKHLLGEYQALLILWAEQTSKRDKAEETATYLAGKLAEVDAERLALRDALKALLDEPYGCSLCDSGKPRNPAKGHQPDCPYERARSFLFGAAGRTEG